MRGLLTILWRGIRAKKRPDVVISATSPPLLLFVATLVAMRFRAKSAHWLFDMYPELALALGEIRDGWFSHFVESLMRWSYRRTNVLVALDDDMRERLKKYGVESEAIAPWVFASLLKSSAFHRKNSAFYWFYSGNLGRAHDWRTLLEAQALLEKRGTPWRLVFQGGGPSWLPVQERAKELGLKNCEWKSYVPENELRDSLLVADVLAVTQKPETQGLLWPSKLALVTTLPRRILWIGPTDGAIARDLRRLPQAGIFAPGESEKVADWLQNAPPAAPVVSDPATVREAALEKWRALLTGCRD